MEEKEIEKLFKKEGDKIITSSFDDIKNKLPINEQQILSSIKKEGEQLIPNNYNSIKEQILESSNAKQTKKSHKNTYLGFGLGTCLAAGLICAVVIPIVNNNNRLCLASEATCEIDVQCESQSILKMSCDINSDGTIKEETLTSQNELAKKIFSGIKAKEYAIDSKHLDLYTADILKFAVNTSDKENKSLLDKNNNYTVSIYISGPGAIDSSFPEKLKNELKNNLQEIKVNEIIVDRDNKVTGNFDTDLLSSRRNELNNLIDKLFKKDDEIIKGFDPEQYFDEETLEGIEDSITTLKEIYNHIPLDSYLEEFKSDLNIIYEIYQQRELELENLKEKCKTALEIKKEDGFINDSELKPVDMDLRDLPSPFWWNNEYNIKNLDDAGFDIYSFYKNDYPKNDETYIDEINKTKAPLSFIIKELIHNYDKSEAPIPYLIETYNFVCKLIEENNKWFSLAFDLIPNTKSICYEDYKEDKVWSSTDYWDDNSSYWDNYWSN